MSTTRTGTALDVVRDRRPGRDQAEIDLLVSVLAWTGENTRAGEACVAWSESFGEAEVPLAGEGAPRVAEFALYELAAALGISSDAGKRYVGRALELRHRLPKLYAKVIAGEVAVWKAGRIAEHTMALPVEGAAYVDTHLAPVAAKVSLTQIERTVATASARFDPEAAETARRRAAESRHADVYLGGVTLEGTVEVRATVSFEDAIDLEDALRQGAWSLAKLGCEEDLAVRRALALGEMARLQLSFDLSPHQPDSPDSPDSGAATGGVQPVARGPHTPTRPGPVGRAVTIYAHLDEDYTGHTHDRHPVLAETIKSWCAAASKVTIKPVIDPKANLSSTAYTVPDAIAEQTELRDGTCVFPYCTRRATSCDKDHIVPWPHGHTETTNLANLCRRHHRTKTHASSPGWSYTPLDDPGTYLWRSPSGLAFLRDPDGTTDLTD